MSLSCWTWTYPRSHVPSQRSGRRGWPGVGCLGQEEPFRGLGAELVRNIADSCRFRPHSPRPHLNACYPYQRKTGDGAAGSRRIVAGRDNQDPHDAVRMTKTASQGQTGPVTTTHNCYYHHHHYCATMGPFCKQGVFFVAWGDSRVVGVELVGMHHYTQQFEESLGTGFPGLGRVAEMGCVATS